MTFEEALKILDKKGIGIGPEIITTKKANDDKLPNKLNVHPRFQAAAIILAQHGENISKDWWGHNSELEIITNSDDGTITVMCLGCNPLKNKRGGNTVAKFKDLESAIDFANALAGNKVMLAGFNIAPEGQEGYR